MSEKTRLNELTQQIIAAAIDVHHELGPGHLESGYDHCLGYEFVVRAIPFERQKGMPLTYKGQRLDCGYRVDFLVDNSVVVELKSIERFEPVHFAQLRSYLRLSNCTVGLLINFNVKWLTADGIRRLVNGFPD